MKIVNEKLGNIILYFSIFLFVILFCFSTWVFYLYKNIQDLTDKNLYMENQLSCVPKKYELFPREIYFEITNLCKEKKLDKDLVFSILLVENPTFNYFALNINENGTIDKGLFQLNDKYLYCKNGFIELFYDDSNVEFNAMNFKHNAKIAVAYINDLYLYFKDIDKTIMAYNCGLKRTAENKIPKTTKKYLTKCKGYYKMLKR